MDTQKALTTLDKKDNSVDIWLVAAVPRDTEQYIMFPSHIRLTQNSQDLTEQYVMENTFQL